MLKKLFLLLSPNTKFLENQYEYYFLKKNAFLRKILYAIQSCVGKYFRKSLFYRLIPYNVIRSLRYPIYLIQ